MSPIASTLSYTTPRGLIFIMDPTRLVFTLSSGRSLGYAIYGMPSSRLEAVVLDGPAKQYGLRIAGVDRPGFGLSPY
ncbi:hypothetical protein MKZ38_000024 [Zalerion maritima]|uniref:Uncharacterized protein n=1 Tax=Zalerion maritima TaxID=339359 RepID=A0AAD5S047_9PEZI|nr:hypothetical protein MKZ38_000024 [Zalerion maritima]